jgi:ribosomal protein S13
MNKYIISTGIVLATISSVSALETGARENIRPVMMMRASSTQAVHAISGMAQNMMVGQGMPSFPTTGDATTDAAIKALQIEMETKIKAIREDYQTKIKAIVGDKKALNRHPMASSTQRDMMRKLEGEVERPVMQDGSSSESRPTGDRPTMMQRTGSSSESRPRPMMGRNEGQVKGAETSVDTGEASGIFGFFGRMFSR